MRRFNSTEKQIIRKICERRTAEDGTDFYGLELLDKCFQGKDVVLSKTEFKGEKVYACDFSTRWEAPSLNTMLTMCHEIYDAALLLKDLETDRYIYFLMLDKVDPLKKILFRHGEKPLYTEPLPAAISEVLTKDAYGKHSINQALFDLCENDFKTEEDLMLEKAKEQSGIAFEALKEARLQTKKAEDALTEALRQTENSRWTLLLSILTFISSLIVSILSSCA